jgi:predicted SAM-dependent methyltransferase
MPAKIDLGCGLCKKAGYLGLDIAPLGQVDVVCDLERGIPLQSDVADSVYANQVLEHIDNTVLLMQEIFRICRPGAEVTLRVPYYTSIGAFKDPTHRSFFTEETFRYFTRHCWERFDYELGVDFKVERIDYTYLRPFGRLAGILPSAWMYPFRRFLWNTVHTMIVELTVVK